MKDYIKSEYDAEVSFKAKKTPMSGALRDNKLDLIIEEGPLKGWRIENKFTEKKSYSLNVDVLEKMRKQAKMCGSKAFVRVDFELCEPYVVISEKHFLELIGEIPDEEES